MRFGRQASGVDMPLFGAEGADKFFVVRDHDYTTFVLADGDGETTDRVSVQEIGWFVEDEQVRVVLKFVSRLSFFRS